MRAGLIVLVPGLQNQTVNVLGQRNVVILVLANRFFDTCSGSVEILQLKARGRLKYQTLRIFVLGIRREQSFGDFLRPLPIVVGDLQARQIR